MKNEKTGCSDKYLKDHYHIHHLTWHDQASQHDQSIYSILSPLTHFTYLPGPASGSICNEEHALPSTAKASLAESSWLEWCRGFGRHCLGAFLQSSYQDRASLLRKGAAGHIYIPSHSLEKYTDSQESVVAVSAGGLLVADTVGKDTGQGTVMCLIYHV